MLETKKNPDSLVSLAQVTPVWGNRPLKQDGHLANVWMVVGASTPRVLAKASSAESGESLQAAVLLHADIQLGCGPVGPLWQRHELFLLIILNCELSISWLH